IVARAQTGRIRVRKVAADRAAPAVAGARRETTRERFQRRMAGEGATEQHELVVYMDRCFVDSLKGDAAADLQGQEYTTPLPEVIFGKDPRTRPSSQTWPELFANRTRIAAELEDLRREANELAANG